MRLLFNRCFGRIFVIGDQREAGDLFVIVQRDQFHALRVTSDNGNTLARHPDRLTFIRRDHDFIGIENAPGPNHEADFVSRLLGDDADATARLRSVLFDRSSLSESVFSHHQDRRLRSFIEDLESDDDVAFTERGHLSRRGPTGPLAERHLHRSESTCPDSSR